MLTGIPVIYGIDPYTQSSIQEHNLGAVGFSSDGRKFRYVKFGGTLIAGNLLQAPAENTGEQGLAVAAAAAIDALNVSVTCGGTVAANLFADGYLVVTTTDGNGIYYKIKSHPALASATAATFELYDPLVVALTTSSKVDLVMNPYKNVIQNPTSASAAPVGVAVIAGTSAYYGWIQTGGPACVLAQGTLTVGAPCVASNATAGAIEVAANDSTEAQVTVGTALTGVATTENGILNLAL
jgi:hypothetical protein